MPDDTHATLMALIVPIIHRPCRMCGRPEPARTGDEVDCSTCLDSGSAGPIFDKAHAEEYAERIAAAAMAVFTDLGHTDACVHPDQHDAVIRDWEDSKAEVKRLRKALGRERKKARASRQAQQDRANQAGKTVERLRAELASAKLDHIADHDDAAGELSKVDVEVERLRSVLDRAIQGREMARIERNALKAAHDGLLSSIALYIDWRYVTRQLTTEQKELFADALERESIRVHGPDGEDPEPDMARLPSYAPRWWRDDQPTDTTGETGE